MGSMPYIRNPKVHKNDAKADTKEEKETLNPKPKVPADATLALGVRSSGSLAQPGLRGPLLPTVEVEALGLGFRVYLNLPKPTKK